MTPQNYAQKLETAREIVEEHNSHLPADSTAKLDWPAIVSKLQAMGATTEETLKELTWEDLEDAGIPRVLARRIANQVFRQRQPRLTEARISSMSFVELFEAYDVRGVRNPGVERRLRDLAGTALCVVVDPDTGKVEPELSARLLEDARLGYPLESCVLSNECKLYSVLRVGDRPDLYVDEDFLYPGTPLHRGASLPLRRDVSQIDRWHREVVYLALTRTHELRLHDPHSFLDWLESADRAALQKRFPQAVLLHAKLAAEGNLPRLRVQLNSTSAKPNDPFNIGSHVRT